MTPNEFDKKYRELQALHRHMESYDANTPISKVTVDHDKAKRIYGQLAAALNKYKLPTV